MLLPLWLPCAIYLLAKIDLGSAFDLLNGLAYGSLTLAGVPYGISALIFIVLLRGRKVDAYYKAAKIAPLLFIPIFAIYLHQTEFLGHTTPSIQDIFASIVWAAMLGIPVGYAYVFVILMGAKYLKYIGKVI